MQRKKDTLNKIKVALIGCGFIGLYGSNDKKTKKYFKFITHFQTINFHPNFTPFIAVDKDKNKLLDAKKSGFKYTYTSIDQIENKNEIDVVVIALPAMERFKVINKFNMVKAIICEKPLAFSYNEILKIENHCKKHKINLYVNYWRRYDKKIVKLKESLLKYKLGKFQTGFATYGGSFFSNGVHVVDLIDFLLGPIKSIDKANSDNEEDKDYLIKIKGNKKIFLSFINFKFYRELYLDLWGGDGRIILAHESLDLFFYKKKKHRSLSDNYEISFDKVRHEKSDAGEALLNLYKKVFLDLSNKKINIDCSSKYWMKLIRVD